MSIFPLLTIADQLDFDEVTEVISKLVNPAGILIRADPNLVLLLVPVIVNEYALVGCKTTPVVGETVAVNCAQADELQRLRIAINAMSQLVLAKYIFFICNGSEDKLILKGLTI
ncbi:hypothetical protein JYG30_15040 [Fibrella sp. USSR17]